MSYRASTPQFPPDTVLGGLAVVASIVMGAAGLLGLEIVRTGHAFHVGTGSVAPDAVRFTFGLLGAKFVFAAALLVLGWGICSGRRWAPITALSVSVTMLAFLVGSALTECILLPRLHQELSAMAHLHYQARTERNFAIWLPLNLLMPAILLFYWKRARTRRS